MHSNYLELSQCDQSNSRFAIDMNMIASTPSGIAGNAAQMRNLVGNIPINWVLRIGFVENCATRI